MSAEQGLLQCDLLLETIDQFPARWPEFPGCIKTFMLKIRGSIDRAQKVTPRMQKDLNEVEDLVEKWIE